MAVNRLVMAMTIISSMRVKPLFCNHMAVLTLMFCYALNCVGRCVISNIYASF